MKRKILNVILLNLLVFFALISIHEIAHLGAGFLLGCERGRAILMDSALSGPYTELVCSNMTNQAIMQLSGLFLTSCFGLLFLSMKSSGKSMFLLVTGLSLIFSSFDIGMLTVRTAIYPMLILGFGSVTAGEYFITTSFIKNDVNFDIFEIE